MIHIYPIEYLAYQKIIDGPSIDMKQQKSSIFENMSIFTLMCHFKDLGSSIHYIFIRKDQFV